MNDYYRQIADHAHSAPQEEVCGFLHFDDKGSLFAVRETNVATDTSKRFEISSQAHLNAIRRGRVAAYYHSHWESPANFSAEDIARSTTARIPVFVYSTFTKSFNLFVGRDFIPNYCGRQFVLGFQDCASLVTDYLHREFNAELPYFARPEAMLNNGFPTLKTYLASSGFLEVTDGQYITGDVVAMSILSDNNVPNHVGIMLNPRTILHQLSHQLSDVQEYSDQWRKRTCFVMRLQR